MTLIDIYQYRAYQYRTYQDLVFWHQGKFHVSVEMLSGKVSKDLVNVKNRLENLFSDIPFYGLEKVAIGFGDIGYQWAARMVVWCNDDICNTGERWITCHPDSPLACEKAPEWIRYFCKQINKLFKNNPDVKPDIRDIDHISKLNMCPECERLARIVSEHQHPLVTPEYGQRAK